MKTALALLGALILAALLFIDFKGYQSLKSMRAELTALRQDLVETREYAERGSSAALTASDRADEARKLAEIAAGARKTAEFQREQAETAAQQAQTQAQQAQNQAQQAQTQMELMRREREEELNQMQQALNRIVETKRTPNGMVMVLPDSVFRFDFDSAELNGKNRELLSRIAGVLLVSKGYGLGIYGYTDDVGTFDYNKDLSLRRAKAVQAYLAQSGVDRNIMSVAGYGKTDPRVKGISDQARAQNRRVEIAVTDSSIKYVGEAPSK